MCSVCNIMHHNVTKKTTGELHNQYIYLSLGDTGLYGGQIVHIHVDGCTSMHLWSIWGVSWNLSKESGSKE